MDAILPSLVVVVIGGESVLRAGGSSIQMRLGTILRLSLDIRTHSPSHNFLQNINHVTLVLIHSLFKYELILLIIGGCTIASHLAFVSALLADFVEVVEMARRRVEGKVIAYCLLLALSNIFISIVIIYTATIGLTELER